MSDVSQLRELRDRFYAAKRKIQRAVSSDLDWAAEEVKMKMRELAPVDTGYLRDNISIIKIGQMVQIGPVGVEYAAAQEYGARPHVIVASPGKILVFHVGSQKVFAKSVKHPGNKPHPYIRPAGDWAREALPEKIGVTGASMLKGRSRA